MIFITGGKYQGRLKCGIEISKYGQEDVFDFARLNSKDYTYNHKDFKDCKIWYNLQEYVRILAENGTEEYQIEKMIKTLVDNNDPQVIIMAEVGAGVIPIEKKEIIFREVTGNLSVYYADKADEVYRVICGIQTRLK